MQAETQVVSQLQGEGKDFYEQRKGIISTHTKVFV